MAKRQTRISVQRVGKASENDLQVAPALARELYRELHAIAKVQLAPHCEHETLRPTALLHEVFIKLMSDPERVWDRAHFMSVASVAMEHVIVDFARKQLSLKRGGNLKRAPLDEHLERTSQPATDPNLVIAIHDAVAQLAFEDELAATIVRFRFFCGMSPEAIAGCLNISPATEHRRFVYARAWLKRRLADWSPNVGEGDEE